MRRGAWLIVLAIAAAPCAARAQPAEGVPLGPTTSEEAQLSADDERARTHFDAGRSHYSEGAYDRARDEFQRAWELSRRPPLLLNLATAEERLGEHAEAAAHLRQYLELVPQAEDRAIIERRIGNLERLHAGHAPATPTGAAPAPSAPVAPARHGPDDALVASGAAALALGAAAAITMGIFGGLALSEDQRLTDECATRSCTDADIADAVTFVLVSDVMIGVAAGAAAIGVILIAVAFATAPSGDVAFAPWIGPDGAGLTGSARW